MPRYHFAGAVLVPVTLPLHPTNASTARPIDLQHVYSHVSQAYFSCPAHYIMTDIQKKTVLVVGAGSVGAIAALNLEIGGLASVTVALRSNYNAVKERGYTIDSCDHGSLKGFRPSAGVIHYPAQLCQSDADRASPQ